LGFKRTAEAQRRREGEREPVVVEFKRLLAVSLLAWMRQKGLLLGLHDQVELLECP